VVDGEAAAPALLEVVTTCGRDEVVFHDLQSGRWWRQR